MQPRVSVMVSALIIEIVEIIEIICQMQTTARAPKARIMPLLLNRKKGKQ